MLKLSRAIRHALILSSFVLVFTIVHMNRVSQILMQDFSSNVSRIWAVLLKRSDVSLSTFYYRAHRRQFINAKTQSQQYLTSEKEKILVTFLLLMSDLERSIRVKYISSLVFSIVRQRSVVAIDDLSKFLNKNWSRVFEKRNSELKTRRIRTIDWKRHENNIHVKITHWFEVIERII